MFKAGDRVRRVKDSHFFMKVGDIATVISTNITGHVELMEFGGKHDVKCLEHAHASPIRTVTRREIVPGTYGRVKVTQGLYVHCNSMRTAEELREAAHILNQLAEFMEDKP